MEWEKDFAAKKYVTLVYNKKKDFSVEMLGIFCWSQQEKRPSQKYGLCRLPFWTESESLSNIRLYVPKKGGWSHKNKTPVRYKHRSKTSKSYNDAGSTHLTFFKLLSQRTILHKRPL